MESIADLWYTAFNSAFGICIECNDVDRTVQRLYAERKRLGDERLQSVRIFRSPTDSKHLWLVKR